MLVLLTTADTDILAAAHAVPELPGGFGPVRCANPARGDHEALLDDVLDAARRAAAPAACATRSRWCWSGERPSRTRS